MAAVDALRLVHAKGRAALWTAPLGCFRGDEALCSDGLDAREVLDDTHPVPRLVAGVKVT